MPLAAASGRGFLGPPGQYLLLSDWKQGMLVESALLQVRKRQREAFQVTSGWAFSPTPQTIRSYHSNGGAAPDHLVDLGSCLGFMICQMGIITLV